MKIYFHALKSDIFAYQVFTIFCHYQLSSFLKLPFAAIIMSSSSIPEGKELHILQLSTCMLFLQYINKNPLDKREKAAERQRRFRENADEAKLADQRRKNTEAHQKARQMESEEERSTRQQKGNSNTYYV